jgi:6-phosphogluconolactonase
VSVRLEVLEDPAAACAQLLVSVASGGGQIVLTGGSTPRVAYQQAAVAGAGAWEGATVWFGDERCVSPDDERSNFRMAREALLEPVGKLGETVHRIQGELGPAEGAEAYERELSAAGSPRFDLMLLGLGPDGHLASLFPGQPSLSERERQVIGVERPGLEPFVARVTMTLRTLASSERIVFLVSGDSKANAVAAAFGPDARPDPQVPASLLPPLVDEITVMLDPAAAAKVKS